MCGINGIFSKQLVKSEFEEKIQLMNSLINHRGPDSNGFYFSEKVCLGSTRLSILDLSEKNNQPYKDESENYILVFNGEIYNYLELQAELKVQGCTFKTSGDTEVLLQSYIKWGIEKLLSKLEGMFAFAIYDKKKEIIICARDHLGQKPFFYFKNEKTFIFSSELKPLIQSRLIDTKLKFENIARYLHYESFVQNETIFSNVEKLLPGKYLLFDLNENIIQKHSYWENDLYKNPDIMKIKNNREVSESVIQEINHSVIKQLRSDVPIGVYCGGGVDSTLVAHLASQKNRNIEGLNLVLGETTFDEKDYVKKNFQGKIPLNFFQPNETSISNIILNSINDVDEPISNFGFIAQSLISNYAKQLGYKVVLSGNGGDELFLGYEPHKKFSLFKLINKSIIMQNSLKFLSRLLKQDFEYMSFSAKLKIFVNSLGFDDEIANSRWLAANLPEEIESFLLNPIPGKTRLNYKIFIDFILKIKKNDSSYNDIEKLILEYENGYLPDTILKHTDKSNMHNSIEARSPLVSHILFDKVNSLKINQKKNKCILRKFLKENNYEVQNTKKGFTVPVAKWINTILRKNIIEVLSERNLNPIGIFDANYIYNKILKPHFELKADNSKKILNLFILVKWMRQNLKDIYFN